MKLLYVLYFYVYYVLHILKYSLAVRLAWGMRREEIFPLLFPHIKVWEKLIEIFHLHLKQFSSPRGYINCIYCIVLNLVYNITELYMYLIFILFIFLGLPGFTFQTNFIPFIIFFQYMFFLNIKCLLFMNYYTNNKPRCEKKTTWARKGLFCCYDTDKYWYAFWFSGSGYGWK